MNSPDYLRCGTLPELSSTAGQDVTALTAKEKLEQFVGRGVDYAASAESPPEELDAAVGSAPGIYSGDASAWLIDAAVHVAETRDPDVLYVSTTDVVSHKHGPDEQPATERVQPSTLASASCASTARWSPPPTTVWPTRSPASTSKRYWSPRTSTRWSFDSSVTTIPTTTRTSAARRSSTPTATCRSSTTSRGSC